MTHYAATTQPNHFKTKSMRLLGIIASVTFVAATNVKDRETSNALRGGAPQTTELSNVERRLQFLNLNENPFVLADIPIFPDDAQRDCPDKWASFVACAVIDCPDVMKSCPSGIFYNDPSNPKSSSKMNGAYFRNK